jgi:FPC/CPF motif-containing protein YcgG
LWSRLSGVSEQAFAISERVANNHRHLFYAFAFILAFQISTLFDDIRQSGKTAWKTMGLIKSSVSGHDRFALQDDKSAKANRQQPISHR